MHTLLPHVPHRSDVLVGGEKHIRWLFSLCLARGRVFPEGVAPDAAAGVGAIMVITQL